MCLYSHHFFVSSSFCLSLHSLCILRYWKRVVWFLKMGQQSLIYSFVARGTMILAEYTEFSGNFTTIASQCLQKLPSTNNRFTYNCDGHTFNYLVESGFSTLYIYICIFRWFHASYIFLSSCIPLSWFHLDLDDSTFCFELLHMFDNHDNRWILSFWSPSQDLTDTFSNHFLISCRLEKFWFIFS